MPPSPVVPSVAICIATCRRPAQLQQTLQSVAELVFDASAPRLRVIVGDNDAQAQGAALVRELEPRYPYPLEALLEPEPGISFVRNRLVEAALGAQYIAFIDDDEQADPGWLQGLLSRAASSGAAAVLGPVQSRFEREPPAWLGAALARATSYPDGAQVAVGSFSTANLLLRCDALSDIEGPFDPAFALTGGSDLFLGMQLAARGHRAVWAADALVWETVPAGRTSLRWYLARRYRNGMVYSMAQQRIRGRVLGSLRGSYRGAGSLAVGGLSVARSVLQEARGAALTRAAGLIAYGVGNLAGAAGNRYREYARMHR